MLDSLSIREAYVETKRNDSINGSYSVNDFDVGQIRLYSDKKKMKPEAILLGNKKLFADARDIKINNAKAHLEVKGLKINNTRNFIHLDSFSFRPTIDRDSFIRSHEFQSVYFQTKTGPINIEGLNFEKYFRDSVISLRKISIQGANNLLFKDKTYPFQHGIIKPMLGQLFGKLPRPFEADSVVIINGSVRYDEISEKSKKLWNVQLKNVRANVLNVKNYDFQIRDSLKLTSSGIVNDSISFRASYNESYLDTLNGFLFAVRTRAFNMPVLNPILDSMFGARIISGKMDTLRLNAIGNTYYAHGKIRMYYKNLKIDYNGQGDASKKSVIEKLITFLANDVLLRRNNQSKTGAVYTERDREKGFLNYWIKMILSGAMSSTGVRSNRSTEKKYKKTTKRLHVPELPDVEL
jgi:hypothetical protein